MELIWVVWFIFGMIGGIVACVCSVCKGKPNNDCGNVRSISDRCGDRCGNNGCLKPLEIDNETLAAYLRTMSVISVSHREAEFLKEAANRLEKGDSNDKDSK